MLTPKEGEELAGELASAFEEGILNLYNNGCLSIETIREVFGMGKTEAAIVKVLSMADVGAAPDEHQVARVVAALDRMKDAGVLKSYDAKVRREARGPRLLTVGWSKMLKFPAQTFTVPVESLTRRNLEVSEVMDT